MEPLCDQLTDVPPGQQSGIVTVKACHDADLYSSALAECRRDVLTVASAEGHESWVSVFNTPRYFRHHIGARRGFYFKLIPKQGGEAHCITHLTENEPGLFVSPLRGTYGGIDTGRADIRHLEAFLSDVETKLIEAGGREIQFSLAPFIHEPAKSATLMNVLWRRGFAVTKHDLNFHVSIDAVPLVDKMERNNQKRVRKCIREGCVFAQCTGSEEYARVYDVICRNRESKGYPVSMTFAAIMEMKALFPDKWHFFSTSLDGECIAGSVCVQVARHVLYVFYWGDLPRAHALSPVAFHASHLYEWCHTHGMALLDVGTSTSGGVPNLGLMKFKERLGCHTSLKVTMGKLL